VIGGIAEHNAEMMGAPAEIDTVDLGKEMQTEVNEDDLLREEDDDRDDTAKRSNDAQYNNSMDITDP